MALVGLEATSYQVLEDAGAVEVCVVVFNINNSSFCSVVFPFDVVFTTVSDSAGNSADLIESMHAIMYSKP